MDARRRRRLALAPALAVLTAALSLGAAASGAHAQAPSSASARCPWMNARLTPARRAELVVHAMSPAQEVGMLHSLEPTWRSYYGTAGHVPAQPRLCLPALVFNDAGGGVGDGQTGTTAFPAGLTQASTWDPALQGAFGDALGEEASAKGIDTMLAPGVNLTRVPMDGRTIEYFGEDPYLAGRAATAEVLGIQRRHVIAVVKHLAAYNQQLDRSQLDARVDDRTLHELYLTPFEAAIHDGHVGGVMCSYSKLNGVPDCQSRGLLTGIVKREMGFRGFVVSDWDATHSTVDAANAGLDMEMALTRNGRYYGDALLRAVRRGAVSKARLDDMTARVLRTMFAVGVIDHPPVPEPSGFQAAVTSVDHAALAQRLADEGSVLLRNQGAQLPLEQHGLHIAVIGYAAAGRGAARTYSPTGSTHVAARPVTELQAITARAQQDGDTVTYADGSSLDDAVAAAGNADVVVVVANSTAVEYRDRLGLGLGYGLCPRACPQYPVTQETLIRKVAAANPHTVVLLKTTGAVTMPWIDDVASVLELWFPGQQDGASAAALLFGDQNPSGKLPVTFPRSRADLPLRVRDQYPGTGHVVRYREGLLVGYRWYDARRIAPLFPFGYGLSYTTFAYGVPTVHRTRSGWTAEVSLTNTGDRAGAEVAQAYVTDPAAAHEPPRQLEGFDRVYLQPGESTQVSIPLGRRAFSTWSTSRQAWVVAPGSYTVGIGSSSRDIRGTVRVRW